MIGGKEMGGAFEGSSHLGKELERVGRYFFFLAAAFFAGFLAAAFFAAGFLAASFFAGFLVAIDNPPFPCAVARRKNF